MTLHRRWLAAGAAFSTLAWTGALRAQARPPVVIGWLEIGDREFGEGAAITFKEGMAALGWKLGTQYLLEERYAEGRVERLSELAHELAAKKPAVIVAFPSSSASAATAAAPAIPVVLANGDPLSSGLVRNLAQPGGMVTGLSNVVSDLTQKMTELLIETLPPLQRVGFLADATSSSSEASVMDARQASTRLRVEAVIVDVAKPEDIEPAFEQMAKAKVQAVVILSSAWFSTYSASIIRSAMAQRWPVASNFSGFTRQGGLFSYGPDRMALFRRSAHYVDRILKGAKPGDLPIEQPTVFDLVLNLKTAEQLGIVVPQSMLLRATETIE